MKPGYNILKLKIMNVIDNRTFTTLIIKAQSGQKVAQNQLFSFAEKELKRLIGVFTIEEDEQNELIQESLFKAFRSLNTYNHEKGEFSAWLCTILRNTYFKRYNKKQREFERFISYDNIIDPEFNYLKEDLLSRSDNQEKQEKEKQKEIEAKNKKLMDFVYLELNTNKPQRKEQREIIQMYFLEGLSDKEISEYKNVSLGTVKSQKSRGLKNIRKNIEAKL